MRDNYGFRRTVIDRPQAPAVVPEPAQRRPAPLTDNEVVLIWVCGLLAAALIATPQLAFWLTSLWHR